MRMHVGGRAGGRGGERGDEGSQGEKVGGAREGGRRGREGGRVEGGRGGREGEGDVQCEARIFQSQELLVKPEPLLYTTIQCIHTLLFYNCLI